MSAQTMMLLPGLLCDAEVWQPQIDALEGVRCMVPDWGHADSLVTMARQVLAEAPSERFSLAGHSMGGRVALEVLRLAPQRVERLALLDTGVDPLPDGEAGDKERAGRLALLQLAREQGMRAMGRQWARGMVHPDRLGTPMFEQLLDIIERKTPEIFAAQIQALLSRPDARPVLAGTRCPTLLLCGRQDAWSPVERHEQMQELLPSAQLAVIEDAGHMVTMEQAQAVSAALGDWLGWPAD